MENACAPTKRDAGGTVLYGARALGGRRLRALPRVVAHLRLDVLDFVADFLRFPLQLRHMLPQAHTGGLVLFQIELVEVSLEGLNKVDEFLESVHCDVLSMNEHESVSMGWLFLLKIDLVRFFFQPGDEFLAAMVQLLERARFAFREGV